MQSGISSGESATHKLAATLEQVGRVVGNLLAWVVNLPAFLVYFFAGLRQGFLALLGLAINKIACFSSGFRGVQKRHGAAYNRTGQKPPQLPAFIVLCH